VVAGSSYLDAEPMPALRSLASSVWIQQVGDAPLAQRSVPHGGAEVRCVLGEVPRLLGPLTTAAHLDIPAGGTVVGIRLRPGVVGGLAGMPADELADTDVAATDLWRDLNRLTDTLGDAPTPHAALDQLQRFVGRAAGEADPVVDEAVRRLMPWRAGGPAVLPDLLSISERQLRRRCRATVGMGPKELQRVLRFHGFTARIQAAVDRAEPGDLAGWAVEAGYHDQAHLTRECRRIAGVTPGEFLAQYRAACAGADDHDHVAAYRPMLLGDGRSVQARVLRPA